MPSKLDVNKQTQGVADVMRSRMNLSPRYDVSDDEDNLTIGLSSSEKKELYKETEDLLEEHQEEEVDPNMEEERMSSQDAESLLADAGDGKA